MATKWLSLVLGIVAMSASQPGCNNRLCARKSDCASGLTCSAEGVCVAVPDGASSTEPSPTVDGGSP
ncbi:hypothetical protein BH11MYX1_BH11MYX1_41980 [soil metagenome]